MFKLLDPYRWLIGGVLAAGLIAGFFVYRASLIREGEEREAAKVAQAVAEQKALALAQERNLQEVKDEAIAAAEKRAKQNAIAAAGARSELDRLRKQSGSAASDSTDSIAACTQYAAAANDVLGECAGALVDLAEKADGHVNDIKTLTGAWPAWDKFAADLADFNGRVALLKGQP